MTEAAYFEEPLEPALPIIDPHQHFRDRPGSKYFFSDFLEDVSSGHNVLASVAIECGDMFRAEGPREFAPVGEVEFLNGIAAMYASGKYGRVRAGAGIVGFADLMLGDKVQPVLEAAVAAGGSRLRGIRYMLTWHRLEEVRKIARTGPEGAMRNPAFRRGFGCLAHNNLSFDAYLYHPQLPDLYDLARAFPDTTIILNHTGGPLGVGPYGGKRDEVFADWRAKMREVADCRNVVIKLGGLGLPVMGFGFHGRHPQPNSVELAEVWRPYFETCIELFGPRRCMFESDFPPDKETCSYLVIWNCFKRIAAGFSEAEKSALFSGTAARIYRLSI
jgi:predicted TIM-barrel fold metal-dependent hydrolase